MGVFKQSKKMILGFFKKTKPNTLVFHSSINEGFMQGICEGFKAGVDEFDGVLQKNPSLFEFEDDDEGELLQEWVVDYKKEHIMGVLSEYADDDLYFKKGFLQGFVLGYFNGLVEELDKKETAVEPSPSKQTVVEVETEINGAEVHNSPSDANAILSETELTKIQYQDKVKKHVKRAELAKLQYEHCFKTSDSLDNEITRVFTIFNILILAGGTFVSGTLTSRLSDTYLRDSPLLLTLALICVLVDIIAIGCCWFLMFRCHFAKQLKFLNAANPAYVREADNLRVNYAAYSVYIAKSYLKTAAANEALTRERGRKYKQASLLFGIVFIFSLIIVFVFVFVIATDAACNAIQNPINNNMQGGGTGGKNATECMSDIGYLISDFFSQLYKK